MDIFAKVLKLYKSKLVNGGIIEVLQLLLDLIEQFTTEIIKDLFGFSTSTDGTNLIISKTISIGIEDWDNNTTTQVNPFTENVTVPITNIVNNQQINIPITAVNPSSAVEMTGYFKFGTNRLMYNTTTYGTGQLKYNFANGITTANYTKSPSWCTLDLSSTPAIYQSVPASGTTMMTSTAQFWVDENQTCDFAWYINGTLGSYSNYVTVLNVGVCKDTDNGKVSVAEVAVNKSAGSSFSYKQYAMLDVPVETGVIYYPYITFYNTYSRYKFELKNSKFFFKLKKQTLTTDNRDTYMGLDLEGYMYSSNISSYINIVDREYAQMNYSSYSRLPIALIKIGADNICKEIIPYDSNLFPIETT